MKKILIICTTDSMIWNFLIPHIKYLEKSGCEVECACSETGFYYQELIGKYNLKVHKINFNRSPYNVTNLFCLNKLINLINSLKCDYIYCHEPVGGAYGRIAGFICSKKVIYMAHGFHFYKGASLFKNVLYGSFERILARITDVIITINAEDFSAARKFKLKDGGKIFKTNGIGFDIDKFRRSKVDYPAKRNEFMIPADAFLIVSVGELIKRKNYEVAIKAFAKANIKNSFYLICGDGELELSLKQMVKDLNLVNKVIFAGFRKDISEILSISDLFLFTTYQEGLGIASLEAMSNGLPLLVSDIRGVREYAVNNQTGFNVEPWDVDGFSNRLLKLASDEELRNKFGEHNRINVKSFGLEYVLRQMKDIYKEVGFI